MIVVLFILFSSNHIDVPDFESCIYLLPVSSSKHICNEATEFTISIDATDFFSSKTVFRFKTSLGGFLTHFKKKLSMHDSNQTLKFFNTDTTDIINVRMVPI